MSRSPKKQLDVTAEQTKYWDGKSQGTVFTTPFHLDHFVKYVGPEARVLDYGCGYGRVLEQLEATGFATLCGLDTSQGMVKAAQSRLPKADIRLKTGRQLPFDRASFDAIILLDVLCCVIPNTEQVRVIEDCKRLLKPGGFLYIGDYLINDSDDVNLQKYNDYKEMYKNEEFDYEYGVFETDEGVLCRHQDKSFLLSLLEAFTVREFQDLDMINDANGEQLRGFFLVASFGDTVNKPVPAAEGP